MKKVRLMLSKLNILALIALGKRIYTHMLNNSNFENPPADLAAANTNSTALETSYNKAKATNDKQEWAKTRTSKTALKVNLRALANFIDEVAKGNEEIILSAGVEVNKDREKKPAVEQVTEVVARFTNMPGKILLLWAMSQNARFYEVYMTTAPEDANSWVMVNTITGRKLLVDNLASGTRYWFKVVAKGIDSVAPASDPASQIAA